MTSPTMIMFIKKLMDLDEDYIMLDYTFIVGDETKPIPFKGTLVKKA